MTEDDKKVFDDEKVKAWEKQAGTIGRSQNLKKHRKTFNRGYNAGFQAGRDSKGDGWCFDMDKAPLQEPCEIAYSFEGGVETKITFLEDGVCAKTGIDYGGGISWNGVSEYLVTVYAWRLSVPPPLPKDRKKG